MRPNPVIKWFYCFAYVVTIFESAYEFIGHSYDFSLKNFSRIQDVNTVYVCLVMFVIALSIFLTANYFFVEQYESQEGVFEGTTFDSSFSQKGELVLRLILFFFVSFKFIRWSESVSAAAIYLIFMLTVYIAWFLFIGKFSKQEKCEGLQMFLFLKVTVVGAACLFLPTFASSFFIYEYQSTYVLPFVISSVLLSLSLAFITACVVHLVFMRWSGIGEKQSPV